MIDHTKEMILDLCEGNPGAINVLMSLCNLNQDIKWFEENGIRGSKIWVAYKDLSNQDIFTLIENMETPGFAQRVLNAER